MRLKHAHCYRQDIVITKGERQKDYIYTYTHTHKYNQLNHRCYTPETNITLNQLYFQFLKMAEYFTNLRRETDIQSRNSENSKQDKFKEINSKIYHN